MRLHTLSAILSSLTVLAVAATPAVAAETGGVAAGSTGTSAGGGAAPTVPATPKPPVYLSPVTAKTSSVAYGGPVYEKTATGQVVPYTPSAAPGEATAASNGTGGSSVSASPVGVAAAPTVRPELLVPGMLARYVDGIAAAPESAPAVVQEIIWAGNHLIGLPYIYGGGHNATFTSPGYDCSGTVSFALHGASLLTAPEDSSEFEAWGSHGVGRWVTIFANAGHAYMTVAGLRLDTSPANDPSNLQGPRWRPLRPENASFVVRHPLGL